MRGAFLVLCLGLLSACQGAPTLTARETFRDPRVQIASKADFDPTAFAGDWHEIARFPGGQGCAGGLLQVRPAAKGLTFATRCPDGSQITQVAQVAPFGRLSLSDRNGTRQLWVLWTDTTYRTAVVVAPDGTSGMILNRTPNLPADRRQAALEVLAFNGFATGALRIGN